MELRNFAVNRKELEIKRKRTVLEAKIASLQDEFESIKDELNKTHQEEQLRQEIMEKNRRELTEKRYLKVNNAKAKKN